MVKKHYPSILVSLLLILTGCSADELKISDSVPAAQESSTGIPGEAILLLTEEAADGFGNTPLTKSLDAIGIQSIERIFPDAGPFEARHRAAGLHRWYRVTYDPSISQTKAGNDLSALPGVEAVDFPLEMVRMSAFNDPNLYHQWQYKNTAQRSGFKAGADINVEPVWQNYTGGAHDVIVAVIDGGVDHSHEDLAGVVLSAEEGSRNFLSNYQEKVIHADDHGTHVAGTIAAINDNGIGVCGVAGGTDGKGGVRIMSCEIFGPHDGDRGNNAQAFVWAADHGAVIANCSWGNTYETESETRYSADLFLNHSSSLKSAIDYFIDNAGMDENGNQVGPMKGGVIFFASGNEGFRYGVPAIYDRVFAVGAFGPDGKMPVYSNYGDWVDLLAPGGSDSDFHSEEWVLSTVPTDNYGSLPGTSMATPHASGVAALLVSYFGGPGFTNEMLKEAILGGSTRGAINLQGREIGGGKLDALGAFKYLLDKNGDDPGKISLSTDCTGAWSFKSHERKTIHIRISGNARQQLPVTVETDCPGITWSVGFTNATLTLDAMKTEPGDYTVTLLVGNRIEGTYPLTILPNHAPEQTRPLDNFIINANSGATFSVDLDQYFQDPDGETLTYMVSVSGDPIATAELNGATLKINPKEYGLATICIQASDARETKCAATSKILGRDASRPLDIYPNPVSDWLHVRPGKVGLFEVRLVNGLGACVYESGSVTVGPFSPLDIDMQGLPGGIYSLSVNGEIYSIAKK